ncbi:hypothetical protein C0J52_14627 [Blattella germanica]|nr:hypothetical protein C0J52_14627 [Blattella germanica]
MNLRNLFPNYQLSLKPTASQLRSALPATVHSMDLRSLFPNSAIANSMRRGYKASPLLPGRLSNLSQSWPRFEWKEYSPEVKL